MARIGPLTTATSILSFSIFSTAFVKAAALSPDLRDRAVSVLASAKLLSRDDEDEENNSFDQPNWFPKHWKWVMMLIILFVGLSLLAVLAVCLKRHYHNKWEEKHKFPPTSGQNIPWGPPSYPPLHQNGGPAFARTPVDTSRYTRESAGAGTGPVAMGLRDPPPLPEMRNPINDPAMAPGARMPRGQVSGIHQTERRKSERKKLEKR